MQFLEQKKFYVLVTILGLIGVGYSYYYGMGQIDQGVDALWGGTPDRIKPIYFITTSLAFIGYSLVFFFLVFKTDLVNYYSFSRSLIVILVPSMLWILYTSEMIQAPSSFTWVKVRLVLILAAFGAWLTYRRLTKLMDEDYGIWRKLAIAGAAVFLFHALVMDALLWPYLFK